MFTFLNNDAVKRFLFVLGAAAGSLAQVLPSHTIGAQVAGGVFSILGALGLVSGGTSTFQPKVTP